MEYSEYKAEVEVIVREAIEEVLRAQEPADLDELREKVQENLEQTIDGHQWVIYNAQAFDLYACLRRCDCKALDEAEEELEGNGMLTIDDATGGLDGLFCRFAYWILLRGCEAAYEDELERIIDESKEKWEEAGKTWARGFKDNPTREDAYEAEQAARDYTPFEFTAAAINRLPWADEAWEAFDAGIASVFAVLPSEDDLLWVCEDCAQAIANDDFTGLDYSYEAKDAARRQAEIQEGMDALGPVALVGKDDEFSSAQCDCCGTRLAGKRYAVVKLPSSEESK